MGRGPKGGGGGGRREGLGLGLGLTGFGRFGGWRVAAGGWGGGGAGGGGFAREGRWARAKKRRGLPSCACNLRKDDRRMRHSTAQRSTAQRVSEHGWLCSSCSGNSIDTPFSTDISYTQSRATSLRLARVHTRAASGSIVTADLPAEHPRPPATFAMVEERGSLSSRPTAWYWYSSTAQRTAPKHKYTRRSLSQAMPVLVWSA